MKKFPGTIARGKYGAVVLSDEQLDWLRREFPKTENRRLMKAMNITHNTLHRLARQYKLTKSEAGLKAIMKRQAKEALKINKAYHESIRGKRPSQATFDGYQAYLHSGRWLHPVRILKAKNPAAYQALMQRKSETHRALWEQARKRMERGLSPQSNLHIHCYTKSQICHRLNAYKRGYIIPHSKDLPNRMVIWYDEETDRAEIFEKNLRADGFLLKEY